MTKIFLDANVLIDINYDNRPCSEASSIFFAYLIDHMDKYEIHTSCDLITTVYYVLRKQHSKSEVLGQIKKLNKAFRIIEFGNDEINEAIELMERNDKYKDFEDTIQYVMARRAGCDYIISNDSNFASGDVPVLSAKEALGVLR